jgi:four helix bundle protein
LRLSGDALHQYFTNKYLEKNIMEFQFEKLDCWQESRKLVLDVYRLIKKFPTEERYGLCDQLRRAVIPVPSNIAEGNGRIAVKEQTHFLEIAYGSVSEVYCQLQLAVDLEYITQEDFKQVKPVIFRTSRLISALRNSKLKNN